MNNLIYFIILQLDPKEALYFTTLYTVYMESKVKQIALENNNNHLSPEIKGNKKRSITDIDSESSFITRSTSNSSTTSEVTSITDGTSLADSESKLPKKLKK